jgi:predicted transcriptional regulator
VPAAKSPSPDRLPRREREVMDALYALGASASVEDVRARLNDPPSYSAVRAMLARLEAKGFVRHREDGPRYLYSPTPTRSAMQRSALKKMVQVFFDGSRAATVTTLLKQETWTDEELDALSAEIERARQGRRTDR